MKSRNHLWSNDRGSYILSAIREIAQRAVDLGFFYIGVTGPSHL